MTKRLRTTGIAGTFGLLCVLAAPAYAVDEVLCTFIIQQDASKNVKASYPRARQHVNADELAQLVPSDPQAYEMKDEGNNRCRIRHTGHRRLVVHTNTEDLKLDRNGETPTCEDLQARVICREG